MNPDRYRQIKEIVLSVLDGAAHEREGLIEELTGGDEDLRRDVERLLDQDVAESFLDHSPVGLGLSEDAEDLSGRTVGRFEIEQLVAKGGIGEVYAGTDSVLKRSVAIKVMRSGLRLSPARRSAFLAEAQVLSGIKHPNICEVYDFFEDRSQDILVLELIDGVTLRQAIADGIARPFDVARQIALALAAAHARGIAHRDLKPENVMLQETAGSSAQVKVLDFGLARSGVELAKIDRPLPLDTDGAPAATELAGTPAYMAPEQARGEAPTTASDLWAFGLIILELLTGNRPYSEDASALELLERAKTGRVDVPSGLGKLERRLLHALLSPSPEDRPTAREALQSIDAILKRPQRRLRVAAAAVLLAAAGAVGVKYTMDLQHERQRAEELVDFMLDELYVGLREVGRLELLEPVAQRALEFYGDADASRMRDADGRPAVALRQIGEVLESQGRQSEAIEVHRQSAAALERLSSERPSELTSYRLALTLRALADGLKSVGRYDEAIQEYGRVVDLSRELTADVAPGAALETRPNASERWALLLRSLYLTADSHVRRGHPEDAIELLERELADARSATDVDPSLSPHLADMLYKRCQATSDAELRDSLAEACEETLAFDELVLATRPDDFRMRRNVATGYGLMSEVYDQLDQLQRSLDAANTSVVRFRELVAEDTTNIDVANDLAATLRIRAEALRKLGRADASRRDLEETLAIVEPITEQNEELHYLNNKFLALYKLGRLQEAEEVARYLLSQGFGRREFLAICAAEGWSERQSDAA